MVSLFNLNISLKYAIGECLVIEIYFLKRLRKQKSLQLKELTWWIKTVEGVIPGTVFTSMINTYKSWKLSEIKI